MEASRSISRRRFLAAGAGAAAAVAAAGLLPADAWAHGGGHRHGRRKRLIPKRRIGIQLFTVRDLLAADAAGTLAALAEIGYREVEVAGRPGRPHGGVVPRPARPERPARDRQPPLHRPRPGAAVRRPPGRGDPRRGRDAGPEVHRHGRAEHPARRGRGRRRAADRRPLPRARRAGEPVGRGGGGARAALLRAPALLGLRDRPDDAARSCSRCWPTRRTRTSSGSSRTSSGWSSATSTRSTGSPCFQDRFPLFHAKDGFPDPSGGYFDPGFTDLGEGEIDFAAIFGALDDPRRHHFIVERDDQPHPLETAEIGYDYLRDLRAPKRRRRGGDCDCEDDDDRHGGGRHEERRQAVR